MANRIKKQLQNMHWLSILILRFGLPIACTLLIASAIAIESSRFTADYVLNLMPDILGRVGIALFTEVVISALFVDYYDKKHAR